MQLLERRLHLHGIAIAILGIQPDRFLQELRELRAHPRDEPVVTRERPFERPLRQLAREQPVQHQAQGKHVRLELGASHGLFRRDVVDGARTGSLQRAQADLRETEVGELQLVTGKQDEVFRLDITVDDPVFVRVRQGRDRLAREVESP